MKRIESVFIALTFILFWLGSTSIYCQEEKLEVIDEFILTSLDKWDVPGLAIAIVQDVR